MSRWRFGLAVAIALITGIAFGATVLNDDAPRPSLSAAEDDTPADYDYVIPVGTGERIDAGERIDILPAELQVTVGESIRITNDDSRGSIAVFNSASCSLLQ